MENATAYNIHTSAEYHRGGSSGPVGSSHLEYPEPSIHFDYGNSSDPIHIEHVQEHFKK
jgi:hypothetical protein